jgi:hypothetical protein
MKANERVSEGANSHIEVNQLRDQYQKRQTQGTIKFAKKESIQNNSRQQSRTIEARPFNSCDNTNQAAGAYKPKIQVPRQPMGSHITHQHR